MNKSTYFSLLIIILCTSRLYSMGMEIYDLDAHQRQYEYEQALRDRPLVSRRINELSASDRAVVKYLETSEEAAIRQVLVDYSDNSLQDVLPGMENDQKNRLYLLLLAYQRRIARKEDEGIITRASKAASPIGFFSAIGGLATGTALALTHHLIAEGGMTLAKQALLGGGAYASSAALGGGVIVSLVSTPVALICMGYENGKWHRVHDAAETIRKHLDIAELPVINEIP